jgi:hypothetical protein
MPFLCLNGIIAGFSKLSRSSIVLSGRMFMLGGEDPNRKGASGGWMNCGA